MTERIPPEQREHETYESDEWTTAHIDAVDNLFVSDSGDPESDDYVASHARIGNPDRVRIDLDGVGSGGASAHDLHDNVQASIWLSPEFAEQLYRDLGRILDSDTNDAGDTEADQ